MHVFIPRLRNTGKRKIVRKDAMRSNKGHIVAGMPIGPLTARLRDPDAVTERNSGEKCCRGTSGCIIGPLYVHAGQHWPVTGEKQN